jgi:hypothetical protein
MRSVADPAATSAPGLGSPPAHFCTTVGAVLFKRCDEGTHPRAAMVALAPGPTLVDAHCACVLRPFLAARGPSRAAQSQIQSLIHGGPLPANLKPPSRRQLGVLLGRPHPSQQQQPAGGRCPEIDGPAGWTCARYMRPPRSLDKPPPPGRVAGKLGSSVRPPHPRRSRVPSRNPGLLPNLPGWAGLTAAQVPQMPLAIPPFLFKFVA